MGTYISRYYYGEDYIISSPYYNVFNYYKEDLEEEEPKSYYRIVKSYNAIKRYGIDLLK